MTQCDRNPIYALKLAIAELDSSTLAWLDASATVMAQLTQELPLIDCDPLQSLTNAPTDQTPPTVDNSRERANPSLTSPGINSGAGLFKPTRAQQRSKSSVVASKTVTKVAKTSALSQNQKITNRPSAKIPQSIKDRELENKVLASISHRQIDAASVVPKPTTKPVMTKPVSQLAQLVASSIQEETSTVSAPPAVAVSHNTTSTNSEPAAGMAQKTSAQRNLFGLENAAGLPKDYGDEKVYTIDHIERLTQQLLGQTAPSRPSSSLSPQSVSQPPALSSLSDVARFTQPRVPPDYPSSGGAKQTANGPTAGANIPKRTFSQRDSSDSVPLSKPFSFSTVPQSSPELDETLTDWVNETLKEQAHRHGVDLS